MSDKSPDIETSSSAYARRFNGEQGAWLLSVQAQLLREALSRVREGERLRVLDVGGGHLQIARAFQGEIEAGALEFSIVGSDESTKAQWENSELKERISFSISDLFSTKYAEGEFDVVFCIRLLTHCAEWRRLVTELCRISKRAVIIDYPPLLSSNILYPLLFPIKKLIEKDTRTFSLFMHRELDEAFTSHGFSRVYRKGQFLWPMVVHRSLKCVPCSEALERIGELAGLRGMCGNPVIAAYQKSMPR